MRVVASFDPSVTNTIPSGPLASQTGGTFDLKQAGRVKFKIKNDSNISIHCYFPNGSDTVVVAGEEMLFCMDLPTSIVNWIQDTALNVNGKPLVSRVYVTLYDQTDREQGTYPFHITRLTNLGSTVPIATSANVSTLSNEGNASQTLIIDIGQVGHTLLVTINSDGSFTWDVLQSGTAHQVIQAQTSGTPLLLGQSGDTVDVLGSFKVEQQVGIHTTPNNGIGLVIDTGSDTNRGMVIFNHSPTQSADLLQLQDSSFNTLLAFDKTGHIIMNNNVPLQIKDSGGTARACMYIDPNDQLIVTANSGPGGGHGAVVFQSDSAAVWKIQSGTQGPQLLAGSINLLAGSISRMDGGVVNCGSGTTISHGCGGSVAPTVIATPHSNSQPASATISVGNESTTTFQATIGALSQIAFWAFVR